MQALPDFNNFSVTHATRVCMQKIRNSKYQKLTVFHRYATLGYMKVEEVLHVLV
jgi:hypothetical protein